MIILREITDISRVEYARSLEKISDIMIASTSHDMRTPLNTIVNMIKLIKIRCTDKQILELLEVTSISSSLLLYLVNDTLDYYQIKSGKFLKKDGYFNVASLLQNCFDLVSIQMEQKSLMKIMEIDPYLYQVR